MKSIKNIIKGANGEIYLITASGETEQTDAARLEPIATGADWNDISPEAKAAAVEIIKEIQKEREQSALMPRPTYYGQKGRALVWYWRACSAYDLAARIAGPDGVTAPEYEKAASLLARVTRYACNAARQWERANTFEKYANSQRAKDDEKRLDQRREKLQKELEPYGAKMVNYGLYPSIIDSNGVDLNALHFFN